VDEFVPICLALVIGALIRGASLGRKGAVVGFFAISGVGGAATVASGEYLLNWSYLLIDCGEAALGLLVGFAAFRCFWPKPIIQPQASAPEARDPL
jgi:hypothetical protein